ncbi:MAG: hypothetical protein R3B06_29250 [Kofleriaceae bacterium]
MSRAVRRWSAAMILALGAALAAGCGDDPEPACSLPSGVRCDGDTVVTCVSGDVTRRDCGDEGLQCAYVDATAGTTCVASACGVVGPLGRCTGATLSTCTDGAITDVECGADQVCGFVDATTGYGCIAAPGPMSVAGEIRYEDKPLNGTAGFEATTPRAARGITVTVIDDGTMQPLATVAAADNGSYVAHFTAAAGTMVHVTAVARSTFTGRPISVTTGSSTVHGFGSPSFPAAADSTLDLVITDAAGEAAAFNVFDQAVTSMDAITGQLGVPAPVPLRLQWSRGSNDGTYFDGSAIHLLGSSSDDDGYDDTVIQHEIGHYVERAVGRSDSPGGGHNGSPTDPRLAWSEGFATYWAQSVLGQPVYQDSNAGGGFFDNIDTEVTRAAGSGLSQQVSEGMVSQILWDIGDAPSPDDDPSTAETHTQVNLVQPTYLKTAALRAVGTSGVDLVDFLDGWFVTQGLASCAAVRDIVVTARNFPYDFAGPAGACP